jgi:hypothetical protein
MASMPAARGCIFVRTISVVLLWQMSGCFALDLAIWRSVEGRSLSVDNVYAWPGYSDLPGCVKWCFSGCQENTTTTQEFNDCGKFIPSNASSNYDGFVMDLGCSTPVCVCGRPYLTSEIYQRSVRKVYDCALYYCQPALGDLNYQSPDVESIVQVVSGFCIAEGLFQEGWDVVLPGDPSEFGITHLDTPF